MFLPGLKELAKDKYEAEVIDHWNSNAFSESAEHLWDNTVDSDKLLRDVVVGAASKHVEELLDRGEFVELMTSRGVFCLEVLKWKIEHEEPQSPSSPNPNIDCGFWGATNKNKKDKRKH